MGMRQLYQGQSAVQLQAEAKKIKIMQLNLMENKPRAKKDPFRLIFYKDFELKYPFQNWT